MTIVTSTRIRITIATEIVPAAMGLLSVLATLTVMGLLMTLSCVTLLTAMKFDGCYGLVGTGYFVALAMATVVCTEKCFETGCRLTGKMSDAAMQWCLSIEN